MTRLTVGQVVPCIAFRFTESRPADGFMFMPYMPMSNNVESIHLLKLTVAEHHKVRTEYDAETVEPSRDGYVLTDSDGVRWNNEYPRASVSQCSVAGLYIVERDLPKETASEWLDNNLDALLAYHFLDAYLDDVRHTIEVRQAKIDDGSFNAPAFVTDTQRYREHYSAVIKQAVEELNCTIDCASRTRIVDGQPVPIKNWYKHTINFVGA